MSTSIVYPSALHAHNVEEYAMKFFRLVITAFVLVCCLVIVMVTSHAGGEQSSGISSAPSAAPVMQGAVPEPTAAPVRNAPRIFFTDVAAGPTNGGPNNLGVPISIFGKGFGEQRRNSRVTIGGVEVASYLIWGTNNAHNKALDMIVVQPGSKVAAGPIVVTVDGESSNSDLSFAPTPGRVLYVAPNGSDSASCSQTAPCASLLHTIEVMKSGEALLIRGGTYAEGEIWIRAPQGGAAKANKVIKNYPGEEVYFPNAARDVLIDADYVTVSGINFKNGKGLQMTGWASRDQRGNNFINNTFSGTVNWAAIETAGHDHVLAGNVCDISGATTGTMGHCYYITQGSNLKILYNVANGAPGYGLHIYEERREANDFKRVIKNVLVEGNLLTGSRQRSGMIISVADAGGYGNHIENITVRNNVFARNNHAGLMVSGAVEDLKIYNNTFFQNGRVGVYIENESKIKRVDVRNNLIYQGPNSTCAVDCSALSQAHTQIGAAVQGLTLTHNSYHPGGVHNLGVADESPITGVVHFANEASLDFHLVTGTAVLRRGAAVSAVPTDFDGRLRPLTGPYDTGAYQFVAQ
jgi:hypothetical protein